MFYVCSCFFNYSIWAQHVGILHELMMLPLPNDLPNDPIQQINFYAYTLYTSYRLGYFADNFCCDSQDNFLL